MRRENASTAGCVTCHLMSTFKARLEQRRAGRSDKRSGNEFRRRPASADRLATQGGSTVRGEASWITGVGPGRRLGGYRGRRNVAECAAQHDIRLAFQERTE